MIDASQYVESAAALGAATVPVVGAQETRRKKRRATKRVKIEKVAMMKYPVLRGGLNECGIYPLRSLVSLSILRLDNSYVGGQSGGR